MRALFHAGGAVVQFCRQFIVCWLQCFSTGFFCGLRYNPIRIQRLFLPTFSGKTDGTKLQTSEAFAIWRGRATERTRPAACGGARDVEFVRTSRRRHSCGLTAFNGSSGEFGQARRSAHRPPYGDGSSGAAEKRAAGLLRRLPFPFTAFPEPYPRMRGRWGFRPRPWPPARRRPAARPCRPVRYAAGAWPPP